MIILAESKSSSLSQDYRTSDHTHHYYDDSLFKVARCCNSLKKLVNFDSLFNRLMCRNFFICLSAAAGNTYKGHYVHNLIHLQNIVAVRFRELFTLCFLHFLFLFLYSKTCFFKILSILQWSQRFSYVMWSNCHDSKFYWL